MSRDTVTLDLPAEFAAADNAMVVVRNDRQFAVTDADTVEIFVAALGPVAEGWGVPAAGVPITRIRVDLFAGDRVVGAVGVSSEVLTVQVRGNFLSRSSSESIATALLAVLDKEWLLDGDAPKLTLPPHLAN